MVDIYTLNISKVDNNFPDSQGERYYLTLSLTNALQLIGILGLRLAAASKKRNYVAISVDGFLLEGDHRNPKDTFWGK